MAANSLLDLSFDENGNQLGIFPICQSTPQKPRQSKSKQTKQSQNLLCPHCGKVYVVKFYFDKHLETHRVQAPDNTLSDSVHLNASDVSFTQLQLSLNPTDSTHSTFRVPAVPGNRKNVAKISKTKGKRKPHLICTYCSKAYVCSRSFKTHVRTHLMQNAASHYPDTKDMINHSEEMGMKALIAVSNEKCFGESTAEFRQVVGYVVAVSSGEQWKKFTSDICAVLVQTMANKKCLLPSALVNTLMEQQENVLSDFDLCDKLLAVIGLSDQFSPDVCAQFFLKFLLYFTTEQLQYISKTFKTNLPRRRVVNPIGEPDKEDRQVIYYIAGSIVRGYVKVGRRYPKSKMWQEVVSVLRSKLLIDKPTGDIDPDAEWTHDVDRGALFFINKQCQELFVKVIKVVFSFEGKDGSINYEAVINEVCKTHLCVDWDNIIANSLSESTSINLLCDIVKCFCKTCGRGVAKRRLNFIRCKPVASMTTRHLAASRKNR